jgi:hypothetical protein
VRSQKVHLQSDYHGCLRAHQRFRDLPNLQLLARDYEQERTGIRRLHLRSHQHSLCCLDSPRLVGIQCQKLDLLDIHVVLYQHFVHAHNMLHRLTRQICQHEPRNLRITTSGASVGCSHPADCGSLQRSANLPQVRARLIFVAKIPLARLKTNFTQLLSSNLLHNN